MSYRQCSSLISKSFLHSYSTFLTISLEPWREQYWWLNSKVIYSSYFGQLRISAFTAINWKKKEDFLRNSESTIHIEEAGWNHAHLPEQKLGLWPPQPKPMTTEYTTDEFPLSGWVSNTMRKSFLIWLEQCHLPFTGHSLSGDLLL